MSVENLRRFFILLALALLSPSFSAHAVAPDPLAPLFAELKNIPQPDPQKIPSDQTAAWKAGYQQSVTGQFHISRLVSPPTGCNGYTGASQDACMNGFRAGADALFKAVSGQPKIGASPCDYEFATGTKAPGDLQKRCACRADFLQGILKAAKVCNFEASLTPSASIRSSGNSILGVKPTFLNSACSDSGSNCEVETFCRREMFPQQDLEYFFIGCATAGYNQTYRECKTKGLIPAQFHCLDEETIKRAGEMLNQERITGNPASHEAK